MVTRPQKSTVRQRRRYVSVKPHVFARLQQAAKIAATTTGRKLDQLLTTFLDEQERVS